MRALQREHNDRAWLAWHIAALTRVDPRKFPKRVADLCERRPMKRNQSRDEFWGILHAHVIAAGGKVN